MPALLDAPVSIHYFLFLLSHIVLRTAKSEQTMEKSKDSIYTYSNYRSYIPIKLNYLKIEISLIEPVACLQLQKSYEGDFEPQALGNDIPKH